MHFLQLCEEVGEWSRRNFGEQSFVRPLVGCLEEIGELSHAWLKLQQGIRGDKEKHITDMKDAVGDIMVFLADACSRHTHILHDYTIKNSKKTMQEIFSDLESVFPSLQENSDHCIFAMTKYLGYIHEAATSSDDHKRIFSEYNIFVDLLICSLMQFCLMNNINFSECVEKTWNTVKERNWKINPTDGTAN